MQDWTGDTNSIFKTLGATSHGKEERQEQDYYATDPLAVELLLKLERFNRDIWEPACGEGHMSKVLEQNGYAVKSTDLIFRGYGQGGIDFLSNNDEWKGDIITNPPYAMAQEFVEHALDIIPDGYRVAMFLKLQFLEGQKRKQLFQRHNLTTVWVSSARLLCAKNGIFNHAEGSAVAYCWFIWRKGYNGDTILKWFN